jgi:hypothetical protein
VREKWKAGKYCQFRWKILLCQYVLQVLEHGERMGMGEGEER